MPLWGPDDRTLPFWTSRVEYLSRDVGPFRALEIVSQMPDHRSDGNESSLALYGAARCGEHREAPALEIDEGRTWLDSVEIRSLCGLRGEEVLLAIERFAMVTPTVVSFYNTAPREKDNEGSTSDSGALLEKASG
jgi:hypothetical protein